MGIPAQFNDIIQKHLNVFAAWIPIVNKYSLGDYGIFSDGVFAKLGNITDDFQVTFTPGTGSTASIDFSSEGASVIKFSGDTEVQVIPAGDVKARIEIKFSNEKSFLVKSPTITVATIENINAVAQKLKATGKWDGQWKVVSAVYNAEDAVVVSTIKSGTTLNFSGDASALGEMKLGQAGVSIDTNQALGLNISGKTGVIGLGLFRIKTNIFGGSKVEIMAEDGLLGKDDKIAIPLKGGSVNDDL